MPIPPVVATILRSVAPTLLTALAVPPPFNLIASAVVSEVLARFLPPDATPTNTQPDGTPTLSPTQVTRVVEVNANDPSFVEQLREAEARLKEYEAATGLKFAELTIQDKTRAGDFQTKAGVAEPLVRYGMAIVLVAVASMLALVVGALLLLTGWIEINKPELSTAVFGLIGAVVGYISGYGGQVIGFYYGSSQGSSDKAEAIQSVLREQGQQLGAAVQTAATAASQATQSTAEALADALPAPAPVVAPEPPKPVQWRQGPFGGLRWQLTDDGILDEGEPAPARTVGEPATVRRIWRDFGSAIRAVCERYSVPVEVVVTTIAVESRGIVNARLVEADSRQSVGLMQTLVGTASEVLGRQVTAEELMRPEVSIEAGVRYIASQREKTLYDPLLTAAAYNAGGLYPPREQDQNPYRLRSTGDHLLRTKLYYNDTVAVAKADGWFKAG